MMPFTRVQGAVLSKHVLKAQRLSLSPIVGASEAGGGVQGALLGEEVSGDAVGWVGLTVGSGRMDATAMEDAAVSGLKPADAPKDAPPLCRIILFPLAMSSA